MAKMPDQTIDIWRQDARTDRAIELLRCDAAKTDADGNVVPRYRYSRNFERVAPFLHDLEWKSIEETITICSFRDPKTKRAGVNVTIEVVMSDRTSWLQEGEVDSSEDAYSWKALAVCRALLHYRDDSDNLMTPEEVIAMLEDTRKGFGLHEARRRLKSKPPGDDDGKA